MFAIITTEEYQNLIRAKDERDKLTDELVCTDFKLLKAEKRLKEVVLMLTKGTTKANYFDSKLTICDIENGDKIAEYLNEKYIEDGILTFTKEINNE